MSENEGPQKPKRIQEKSVRYPYYSLKECLNFAEMIKNIGGRKEAPISSVLKEMNIKDVSNKRYSYTISSSEQFGLIEKTENGLKVTDKVMVILFPTEGEPQKNAVLKECFKKPNLYNLIINQYDGLSLPDPDILKNQFLHYGIAQNVVEKAVDSFIDSAKYANVLKENKLVVKPQDDIPPKPCMNEEQVAPELPEQTPQQVIKKEELRLDVKDYNKLELVISAGKKAIIVLPTDCKKEDIEKIKRHLDAFSTDN
jgi:hypothetical protein